MNILQLVFSPRAGGNCELLARRAEAAFAGDDRVSMGGVHRPASAGARTLFLRDLDIRPCRRCAYECTQAPSGSRCAEDDDVQAVWRAVWAADATVWYVPTFGGAPPAAWLAVHQRYQGLWRLAPPDDVLARRLSAAVVIANPEGATTGEVTAATVRRVLEGGPGRLLRCEVLSPRALGSRSSVSDLIGGHPEAAARVEKLVQDILSELGRLMPAVCPTARGETDEP